MTPHRRSVVLSLIVAACSGEAPPEPPFTAADIGEQTILTPAEWRGEAPWSAGDLGAGERLYRQCQTCHGPANGEVALAGPPLGDVFGRTAGSIEGFAYSPALSAAGFAWTPAALDAWLNRPFKFLPGNQMAFGGLYDATDRRDLIAYLLDETPIANAD